LTEGQFVIEVGEDAEDEVDVDVPEEVEEVVDC
jgi:hypothetical protein